MTNPPLLTIAAGTINRLPKLQRMVESVRQTVPDSTPYEFVLADNGSHDGTAAWIEAQPDCRLIQLGKPSGAVTALTEAGKQARGRYTLIATDDVAFPEYAIMRAIMWLETHPTAGCVAFGNNHKTENVNQFKVEHQGINRADGTRVNVPYPQIALVRTWLGHHANWWGADTVMRGAWTYAGDNHLGYQIYMAGYTCDVVHGCQNLEEQVEDASRQTNRERHRQDATIWNDYYTANPPVIRETPIDPPEPEAEYLRVLYFDGFNPNIPHHAATKKAFLPGLQEAGIVWRFDYRKSPLNAAATLAKIAEAWQPHFMMSNLHSAQLLNAQEMKAIRSHAPAAVWANWVGDWNPKLYTDPEQLALWHQCDALLCTNADVLDDLRAEGINAYHMGAAWESVDTPAEMPPHDVVWQGNGREGHRQRLGAAIHALRQHGVNVGMYGKYGYPDGWLDGDTFYQFDRVRGLYANAKLAVSDNEFGSDGYTSNRFWEIMAAGGAMILHQQTPEFERYFGLKDGVHYIAWTTYTDLQKKIQHWLKPAQQKRRKQIVRNASRLAERHSFAARVRYVLTEVLPDVAKQSVGEGDRVAV